MKLELTVERPGYFIDYNMDDRGSIAGSGGEGIFFSSPRRPDRLWATHSFVFNGYRGFFPGG